MDITTVSIEFGFMSGELTRESHTHERSRAFKRCASQQLKKQVPPPWLDLFRSMPATCKAPYPTLGVESDGHVSRSELSAWLDGLLRLVPGDSTLGSILDTSMECCTETLGGVWKKSRCFKLTLNGEPWRLGPGLARYREWINETQGTPLSASAERELGDLRFVALLEWVVREPLPAAAPPIVEMNRAGDTPSESN